MRPSGTTCPSSAARFHKHRNLLAHAPDRLHEEISADYTDMIYAATREEIEARRKAFIRKWRLQAPRRRRRSGGKPATASSPLLACRQANGRAPAPPTPSSGCMRSSSADKTQTVLPSADTAAMLFWALLASGQINMRKIDGWQTLATKPIDQQIDLAA